MALCHHLAVLINLFSSIVAQRNVKGERYNLASVDWLSNSPEVHRRLLSINAFPGFTLLAIQGPGTDARDRIFLRHVFMLQSMVSSITVSRGYPYIACMRALDASP